MIIKITDVLEIVEHIKQTAPYGSEPSSDERFTFACPQDLHTGDYVYKEIQVYWDLSNNWVIEFTNTNPAYRGDDNENTNPAC